MANVDPLKPVSGKKIVLGGLIGTVVFTLVMLFGTYFVATLMTRYMQKHQPPGTAGHGPATK